MKYIHLFLLIIIITSCNNDTYDQSRIDAQIESSMKTGEVVTESFLNINLRDSMEVVCSKVRDLYKDNKARDRKNIRSDRLTDFPCSEFYYTFYTNKDEVDALVTLFYTKEKRVYEIWILCGQPDNKPDAINEIYSIYKSKYPGMEYIRNGNSVYISIKGKRLIRVQSDATGISISYTDIEYEKIHEKEKELQKKGEIEEYKKEVEKTKDDI